MPTYLDVQPSGIPAATCQLPRWVCWTAERRGDRWTKVPRTPAGAAASSTDPATWSTFEAVLSTYRAGRCAGIGWVLCPPFAGVDFDRVIGADGSLDADTAGWVARFASYTEVSVSGSGLHIIIKADMGTFGKRRGPREAYSGGRYFTLTGHRWPGTPATVENRPDVVRAFLATLGADDAAPAAPAIPLRPIKPAGRYSQLSPRTLDRLNGTGAGGYPSASEADLACCCALVAGGLMEAEALGVFLDSPRGADLLARKGEKHGRELAERAVRRAAQLVGPVVEHTGGLRAHRVTVHRPAAVRPLVGRPA